MDSDGEYRVVENHVRTVFSANLPDADRVGTPAQIARRDLLITMTHVAFREART